MPMTETDLRMLADGTNAEIERIKQLPLDQRRVEVWKIVTNWRAAEQQFLGESRDIARAAFRFFDIPLDAEIGGR